MSYYIYYNSVRYFLDATSDISVTRVGRLTSHPTADKKTRSDNYVVDPPTASYAGVVTDIITPRSLKQMSTGEYIDALRGAMESQSSVGFKYRLDGEEESDWYIISFQTEQSNSFGYGGTTEDGKVVQSFRINITLQKGLFAQVVQTEFSVPASFKDSLQGQTATSSLTKEKSDKALASEKKNKKEEELPGSLQAIRRAAEAQQTARYYRGEGQYAPLSEIASENEAEAEDLED